MSRTHAQASLAQDIPWGPIALGVAVVGAAAFFQEGVATLLSAWQTAEYSHGPLIPLLSAFLFLRQLKYVPARPGPLPDRWPGVAALFVALAVGLLGKFAHIGDVVAYALIMWVGAMLLISFGWERGRHFWPPVLHLVFMLPLPGVIYYKVSTLLQFISSEFGVWMLRAIGVPVFLEGNIIDLGPYQLHVAEACSGLRYLFPIMSFTYIFAVLYRGPTWHKAVLLLSAVPLAVVMNSARIALVGVLVDNYGIDQAEGFAHLMEGWVVFLSCIVILFGLAWAMLRLQRSRMSLPEALDLDLENILPQAGRVRLTRASVALLTAAVLTAGGAAVWAASPDRAPVEIDRQPLVEFPRQVAEWEAVGSPRRLAEGVERTLAADDYLSLDFASEASAAPVSMFIAWYADQTKGGIHSPEVCLPGGGWEIQKIEDIEISQAMNTERPFALTRAVIRKGPARMLVYYWFDQSGRRMASDYLAKAMLLWGGLTEGRTDGALVRLITPIGRHEPEAEAEARLRGFLRPALERLPDFVDGRKAGP